MNTSELTNAFQNMIDAILFSVRRMIDKAPYDRTVPARITGVTRSGVYQISIQNREYPARAAGRSAASYSVGDYVHAVIPGGNYEEILIL